MKTRIMSGSVYVLILTAFYLLKIYVSDYCFDVLIGLFAVMGTYEMARACALPASQKAMVLVFSALWVPVYVVSELKAAAGLIALSIFFCLIIFFIFCSLVIDYKTVTLESTAKAILTAVYPSLFLAFLLATNHLKESNLAILMILVISPCGDSVAYLFGYGLHERFPKKMAPSISPNKTLIGALGGILGGILGSIVLCICWYYAKGLPAPLWEDILFFTLVGLLCAAATEIGDLAESAIKRKAGIKDMGKIMPGHGGILDRIDGTMLVTIVIYLIFVLISAA